VRGNKMKLNKTKVEADGGNPATYQDLTHGYNNKKNIFVKKCPPYSRQLQIKLTQGYRSREIWVWTGNLAWNKARAFPYRDNLVLPPNTLPESFNWRVVGGFEVLAVDTSGIGCEVIRRLAYEILKAGALIFSIILPSFNLAVFTKEEDVKNGK